MTRLTARHYYAIAALAGSTLFAQIALTRLFSVVQYYHGAFLAVSLALFGFAVSGVYVFLRSDSQERGALDREIARHALLFAIAIPACFYFYLYVGVAPLLAAIGMSVPAVVEAALEYAILALPFFASGTCISLLLMHGPSEANRLYAFDLAASALGAVIVVPTLSLLGGPKSMLLASALGASVALPMRAGFGRARALGPAIIAATLAVITLVPAAEFNSLRMRKPAFLIATEPIRWNAFSMVGVSRDRKGRERMIIIDNSVATAMLRFDGDASKLRGMKRDWNAGAHLLQPDSDVLIIGAGGGRDILVARAYEQRSIWAIEVNPLVMEMANETFAELTGRPYTAPSVHPVIGDARSFIANSSEKYGIILASLIDTFAASAAGAFALTENLLYTRDAFRDYYDHLTDDGILSISRWHPLETPRLLATGLAAWRDAGVSEPRRHAMLIVTKQTSVGGRIVILLMKKSPFSPDEIATIERFSAETGRTVALTPQSVNDPVVAEYLRASESGNGSPWPGVDVEPSTDERPFFFNMVKPSTQIADMLGIGETAKRKIKRQSINLDATRTLLHLLAAVIFLLAGTIFLPLAFRASAIRRSGWLSVLGYFTCLGLGYIMIEVGLIQRLILLLGKPVYSLSVILSAMLFSSGLGSFVSGRLDERQIAKHLPKLLILAGGVLLAYAWILPPVIRAMLGSPFPLRVAFSVAIVAIPAFILGMPFPSGIRLLSGRYGSAMIPWVWGVNGAMSVLASVVSVILAIEYGYTVVFALGATFYLCAAFYLHRWAVE